MARLLGFALVLILASTVHCGRWFDGVRNCRMVRCSFIVQSHQWRWDVKRCGHGCTTVHNKIPQHCFTTGTSNFCNAETYRTGKKGEFVSLNGSQRVQYFTVKFLPIVMLLHATIFINFRSKGLLKARQTARTQDILL